MAAAGGPAYALTTNPNGSITFAVFQIAGIAQANARLRELGDDVVVVAVRAGCPQPRPPAGQPRHMGGLSALSSPPAPACLPPAQPSHQSS